MVVVVPAQSRLMGEQFTLACILYKTPSAKKCSPSKGLASNGDVSFEALSEIQKSFLENGGLQCGYCTAGIMMSTKCLLDKNPNPNLNDVQEALAGNICRCTGYGRVIESIFAAAKQLREIK